MFAFRKCQAISVLFSCKPRGSDAFSKLATVKKFCSQKYRPSEVSEVLGRANADHEEPVQALWDDIGQATDITTAQIVSKDMLIFKHFITEEEEKSLLDEVEPYLKRLKYEENHWDDAIHGYRETERKVWSQKNKGIFDRVRALAFPPGSSHLAHVHVLDLKADGVIKAHVDSVKFCGTTIAGLSLLSSAVMRLVNEKNKSLSSDVLLARRSLYIMRNRVRYEYTHEVLGGQFSIFKGAVIPRERRIAVICRNEPPAFNDQTE